MMSRLVFTLVLLCSFVAACSPASAPTVTAAPTETSPPSPPTSTPALMTARPSPSPLPSPEMRPTPPVSFVTETPRPSPTPPHLSLTLAPLKTLTVEQFGLALEYPRDWTPRLDRPPDAPPGFDLRGPWKIGDGPEPWEFVISVSVQKASEQSVAEIVDKQLVALSADVRPGITRTSLRVGGEPAEQLLGMPSQHGHIQTFVLRNGRLFEIFLLPYAPEIPAIAPYTPLTRSVYEGVLASIKFLK